MNTTQVFEKKYQKDTVEFIERMISHFKETSGISASEQMRIRKDSFVKLKEASAYVEFFKKHVPADIKNKRILEFGSGQGIIAMEFSKAGAEVLGIDTDSGLVDITQEYAKQKYLSVKFIAYSCSSKIPIDDDYFDYIYSVQTFEHLNDPVSSVRELYRVLKKGGILHLTFPNRFYPYDDHAQIFLIPWLPDRAADFLTKIFRKQGLKHYSNLHFYSYWQFKAILNKSGTNFSILKKVNSSSFIKKNLIKLMHKCNLHHTMFTKNISVFLEKK